MTYSVLRADASKLQLIYLTARRPAARSQPHHRLDFLVAGSRRAAQQRFVVIDHDMEPGGAATQPAWLTIETAITGIAKQSAALSM
jgi:hypothetical protein